MTTGFDTQPTTFGPILKSAPRPQVLGSKVPPPQAPADDRPMEPRSFAGKSRT
jgi:hypothetical protein